MALLEIKNLSFAYPQGKTDAVKNLNFTVESGEFLVICGESGCGKTTLLKLMKKQLSPYGIKSGEVIYNNKPLDTLDDLTSAKEIGFIMQNPESGIVTDSVWHELCFGLENLGIPSDDIRRKIGEAASYFNIENIFRKKTADLSGGQKQLLNLAAVTVMGPKVLLLDEPTAQLDPVAAADFLNSLQKLNREFGLTVIMAEHRLEDVLPLADRVLLLNRGDLAYYGGAKEFAEYFKQNPGHPLINALPAATKIYSMLNSRQPCPITVKEGRDFIRNNYKNKIDTLPQRPFNRNAEKAVELKEVYFRYEKALPDVLADATFTVCRGEHFCILGSNGAGKTTVLGVIAGLLKPYSGKVLINGKRIEKYKGNTLYRNNVALLPQNPEVMFLHTTVYEELAESCKATQSGADADKRIAEVCDMLGINDLLNCHPYDLSGGEQQKAALAKVLISKPDILLLDEPTKALDAAGKKVISDLIGNLKATGVTVITVTHDMDFAAQSADICGLFFDGKMISAAAPAEFFDNNTFYTTAANRISRDYYKKAILCEQVCALCKQNSLEDAGI